MSDFNLGKKFDSIISMFASIGYLTENSQVQNLIKSAKEHLKEEGLFIIDCWNGLGVMNELPTSRTKEGEVEGYKIIRQSFPTLESGRHINNVKFNVKILKDNDILDEYDEDHRVRFFFPRELEHYLEENGFEVLKICPSFDLGKDVSHKDWNMTIIAKLKK